MVNPRYTIYFGLALFLAPFMTLTAGCSSTQKKETAPAPELLQKGTQLAKIKEFEKAKEIFQQVLEDYPDSRERVAARIQLADVHYVLDEYEEAKFHYQKFIEFYPMHKVADRAHYYKSMTDFKSMEIPTRDQTHTKAALEGFEKLIHDFPNSPFRSKAEQKKNACKETLARNMFEIGKFYYRTRAYQAAILRFNSLIDQYPKQSFIDEAVFLIGESYNQEQNFREAKNIYQRLLEGFPRSEFAKEARDRIRKLK